MKKIVLIISILLGAWTITLAQDSFRIVGQLGGSLGGKLFLVANGGTGLFKLGETEMINGNFEFTGSVPELMVAYILTEEEKPVATVLLENGEFSITTGTDGIIVEGSEDQRILNEFDALGKIVSREKMKMEQEARAAHAEQNQMKLDNLGKQFEKILQKVQVEQAKLMEMYKDSPAAAFVVASSMSQMDAERLAENYNLLGEKAKNTSFGKAIEAKLTLYRQTAVGAIAPEFKGSTPEGETLSLHEIKGKVKLLDFWASWCGPCRQEMPNLRKIYQKYQGEGLEIIGFSLDNKKEEWEKATREDNITWKNISDLRGQASLVAALYSLRTIPCTLLLDENNQIVAKNLRGKDLQKKIEEMLGIK